MPNPRAPQTRLEPGATLHVYGIKGENLILEQLGLPAEAIVQDDDWSYVVCTVPCAERISALGLEIGYSASLPYEQWLDGDMSSPISVVGLNIVPPWCEISTPIEDDVLFIEPGLAFGTGAHPTTKRCLELMAPLLSRPSPKSMTVLDLGCGTGLLGLAALRYGAAGVIGCDMSGHAVDVARRNAQRNGLTTWSSFIKARASEVHERGDLLLANLPPAAIQELVEHESLDSCSWVVASGMLAGDFERLIAAIPKNFVLVEAHRDGVWNTALLRAR